MSNEPIFEILIDVFTKFYNFVLWQIIDGSRWKLCFFFKINGVVVWLMLGQGVYNFLFKHIFGFLVLGRNFMWIWFNIWWGKNTNQECISSCDNLCEGFYSNKQRLGAPRPSCTIEVFFLLQILHAFEKGFTLQGFVLWCFRVKTLHMLIHSWIM